MKILELKLIILKYKKVIPIAEISTEDLTRKADGHQMVHPLD